MKGKWDRPLYAITLIVSVIIAILSNIWLSPPLIVASFASAILCAVYLLYSIREGKDISKKLVGIQLILLLLSAGLSLVVSKNPYPGHIVGMIAIPYMGFMTLICLNSFHTMSIHREVLAAFTILIAPAFNTCIAPIIRGMTRELGSGKINNAMLNIDFMTGFLVCVAIAVGFLIWSKYIYKHRFCPVGLFLEAEQ